MFIQIYFIVPESGRELHLNYLLFRLNFLNNNQLFSFNFLPLWLWLFLDFLLNLGQKLFDPILIVEKLIAHNLIYGFLPFILLVYEK